MKTFLTIIALLVAFSSFGQTAIKKNSIDSGGDISTNGTTKMVYTLGEVAVQENSTGNIHVSEGFIGVNSLVSLDIENYSILSDIKVYPNPTSDYININFTQKSDYDISIYNLAGELIYSKQIIESNKESINLNKFPAGTYLFVVKQVAEQKATTYKIIKK